MDNRGIFDLLTEACTNKVTKTTFVACHSMLDRTIAGTDGQTANLVARPDILGKGASGAAVQNMDLMIGA
jgi:N-acetyl-gamma-glutamylphosphate reductase